MARGTRRGSEGLASGSPDLAAGICAAFRGGSRQPCGVGAVHVPSSWMGSTQLSKLRCLVRGGAES